MSFTLTELLKYSIASEIANINVMIPATVISYDQTKQTITARPVVSDRFESIGQVKPPEITNIPVIFPGSTAWSITGNIDAGSTVILSFAHRSIDEWVMTGKSENDVENERRFSGSDAIAYPGGNSPSNPLTAASFDANAMVLRSNIIKLGSSSASDYIALASLVKSELNSLRADVLLALRTHTHIDPISGSTGIAAPPPTLGVIGNVASGKVKSE